MTTIKIIEDIVNGFVTKDINSVISTLETEIELAKEKGQINVSRRLRNLITRIPGQYRYSPQSFSDSETKEIYFTRNENLVEKIDSKILLEDVVLDIDSKNKVKDLLNEWVNKNELLKYGTAPTNKLLIYGPPGTGKTKLAYGLANKLGIPLILVRLDELISSYLGKTGKNIKDIFDIAKKQDVIIFLDEIDTIAKDRADDKELGELKRIVTVLLQNIDSFPENSIVIGATNHESLLDSAIWRRFPLRINLQLPEKQNRINLFKLFIDGFPSKLNYKLLADLSEGLSGSAIADVSNRIKKSAILEKHTELNDEFALKHIIGYANPKFAFSQLSKKQIYKVCELLKRNGFTLKEIEKITSVPYTTLRDNIK